MIPYEPPAYRKDAFNCPNCNAFSTQRWGSTYQRYGGSPSSSGYSFNIPDFEMVLCIRCDQISIWKNKQMIYPSISMGPLPNPDMPDEIKIDYNEARDVGNRSPRSACVLLRLCIEKICDNLGAQGNDLNEKIGKLVGRGMDEQIQKALDAVRVIGGQAVHPLEMDLRDDTTTANSLFGLVNLISDWGYTQKKKIDEVYGKLPKGKKDAIEKRDNKK